MNVVFSGDIPANPDFGVSPPSVFYPVITFEPGMGGVYMIGISSPDKPDAFLTGNLVVSSDGTIQADQTVSLGADNSLYPDGTHTGTDAFKIAFDADAPVRVSVRMWKIA